MNSENLRLRLTNFKFNSAIQYLDGQDDEVKSIVKALAETFGNVGWFEGSMSEIVEAAVNYIETKIK